MTGRLASSRALNNPTLRIAQRRASDYKRFLPEWPALWQSFQRDAERIEAALKGKK